MKKLIFLAIFSYFSHIQEAYSEVCNIFIHGYTTNSENYWSNLERQVHWDTSQNYQEAAVEVSHKILEQMKTCGDRPITLRSHSYGVPVTFYILGQGNRFKELYPEHDFVKVQEKTSAFYSYSGAYNGTPVMDLICGNALIGAATGLFDRNCVTSLTTNPSNHPSSEVTNPGVPVYIMYSTNRHAYASTLGTIMALTDISFKNWIAGKRNQNDSVLPLHSIRGCAEAQTMFDPEQNCEKIDSFFFQDFIYAPDYTHNGYLENKEFTQEEEGQ